MTIEADPTESRRREMEAFESSMKAMYDVAVIENAEIYDIALRLTDGFRAIDGRAILEDSRILRTLRHAVAPTISQMKFGQIFGVSSTQPFEKRRLTEGSAYRTLRDNADRIASFANENLDRSRFVWLEDSAAESELAHRYARAWTCSLAADQNARTSCRNWRKRLQEKKVADELNNHGYTRTTFRGTVSKATDIGVGQYALETVVQGRTRRKADVAYRDMRSRRLVLVEAKTVGVKLDATKRVKECCDKAGDWTWSSDLDSPDVVAVIAGFFSAQNVANLEASGVRVVWEHRLTDLVGKA